MKLWLLRHGEAEPQSRSDAARELTARGRRDLQASATALLGQPLQAILASPYVRAQQSAEVVRQLLGHDQAIITVPWLTPESDPREVLRELDALSEESLLLVAHQPLLGALAGLLVHGHRQAPLPLSPASLVELEGAMVLAGLMELRGFSHPEP